MSIGYGRCVRRSHDVKVIDLKSCHGKPRMDFVFSWSVLGSSILVNDGTEVFFFLGSC